MQQKSHYPHGLLYYKKAIPARGLRASLAALALLCTGCAFSREATDNTNLTQTEVVLAKKNFRVIGTVYGESTQNYWFGFGGMSKKSLGQSAMSDMYRNADLQGSQAIINAN